MTTTVARINEIVHELLEVRKNENQTKIVNEVLESKGFVPSLYKFIIGRNDTTIWVHRYSELCVYVNANKQVKIYPGYIKDARTGERFYVAPQDIRNETLFLEKESVI